MDRVKLIDETIQVLRINREKDKDGVFKQVKYFEKGKLSQTYAYSLVSRVVARSEVMNIEVEFDVNTDIYPMEEVAYYSMVIANSVNLDGTGEFDILRYEHQSGAAHDGHGSLLDQYQYAM